MNIIDRRCQEMDEGKSGFLLGLLVGGLMGAAIAILMTPQSGEETRKLLREKAEQAGTKAKDLACDVKAKATELAEEVKGKAGELAKDFKDRASELLEKGCKTFISKKEEILEAVRGGQEQTS